MQIVGYQGMDSSPSLALRANFIGSYMGSQLGMPFSAAAASAANAASGAGSPSSLPKSRSPASTHSDDSVNSHKKMTKENNDCTQNYKCPLCSEHLQSQREFTSHIRGHNEVKPHPDPNDPTGQAKVYYCCLCGKMLSSFSSLDRHMLVHSGERPFNCELCGQTFTTNGNMHRHKRTHAHGSRDSHESEGSGGSGPHVVRKVGRKRKMSIERPSLSSPIESPPPTLVEQKRLTENRDLFSSQECFNGYNYLNLHKNMFPFKPTVGGNAFTSLSEYHKRLSDMANIVRATEATSQQIEKEAPVKDTFTEIKEETKKDDALDLSSPMKPSSNLLIVSSTTSNKDLKDLESCISPAIVSTTTHDDQLESNEANEKEISEEDDHLMLKDMKLKGEFPCRLCPAVYPNLRALKGHNKEHMDKAPYKCNVGSCAYSSNDKSTLARHMRTHTGEKPFECKICSFGFTTKANCERHVKNKHGKNSRDEIRDSISIHESANNPSDDTESIRSLNDTCSVGSIRENINQSREMEFQLSPIKRSKMDNFNCSSNSNSNSLTDKPNSQPIFAPYHHSLFRQPNSNDENSSLHSEETHKRKLEDGPLDLSRPLQTAAVNRAESILNKSNTSRKEELKFDSIKSPRKNSSSQIKSANLGIPPTTANPFGNGFPSAAAFTAAAAAAAMHGQVPPLPLLFQHLAAAAAVNGASGAASPQPSAVSPGAHPAASSYELQAYLLAHQQEMLRRQREAAALAQQQEVMAANREQANFLMQLSNLQSLSHTSLASTEKASAALFKDNLCNSDLVAGNGNKSDSENDYKMVIKNGVLMKKQKQKRYRTERPYSCDLCNAKFTLRSNMERHVKQQHPDFKPSDIMKKSGNDNDEDDEEEEEIEVEEDIDIENESPNQSNKNSDRHLEQEDEAEGLDCDRNALSRNNNNEKSDEQVCKTFVKHFQTDLKEEERIETDSSSVVSPTSAGSDTPFKCHLCDIEGFKDRSLAIEHLKNDHETEYKKLLETGAFDVATQEDHSDNGNTDDNSTYDNIRGKFPEYVNRKIMCLFCMRKFWSAEDLRRHVRTHTGDRPYSCDVCQRKFSLKHSMLRHRKKHDSAGSGGEESDDYSDGSSGSMIDGSNGSDSGEKVTFNSQLKKRANLMEKINRLSAAIGYSEKSDNNVDNIYPSPESQPEDAKI